MNTHPHIVIGSGPAGISCAKALLARGVPVLMLDAGVELETNRAHVVAAMAAQPPSAWSQDQISLLKEGTTATQKGIPLKRSFGSDFPYQEIERHLPAEYFGVGIRPSLALGGFSNVWGAAMLPYIDADLERWPVKTAALAEHYRAVLEFVPLAARRDDLESNFPLYTNRAVPLAFSRQAESFSKSLTRHRDELRQAGLSFGASRLAVRGQDGEREGCVYCRMCMYGCPYGHIFNSAHLVDALKVDPQFSYRRGLVVSRVKETTNGVRLIATERDSGKAIEIEGARAYLAGGLIPTTRLLLASTETYEQPVTALDSQYFLFPLLSAKGTRRVREESLFTLSQLFLEIQNRAVNQHTVHLQVYTYNDLIGQAVAKAFGPLRPALGWLASALEERLLIVQGYLHSDDSAQMQMTLRRTQDGPDKLVMKAKANPNTRPAIRGVLRYLTRHMRKLGAAPLSPMLQVAEPGRGFHSGGAFPMRSEPGRHETDTLGRPAGWQRVHAVDATVFPSIPATTITFSVMANAHRIGWESSALR